MQTPLQLQTAIKENIPISADQDIKMQIENLSIFYRDFRAVSDVNMKIYAQKITAIIGPSGCGKSTLLRSFNRMNDLVSGSHIEGQVYLDGEPFMRPT